MLRPPKGAILNVFLLLRHCIQVVLIMIFLKVYIFCDILRFLQKLYISQHFIFFTVYLLLDEILITDNE